MVAFLTSILILVGIIVVTLQVGKRRAPKSPLSWGEAMIAGTFAFWAMFWAYGLVPHLWLTWADSELKWRPNVLLSDYPFWGVRLGFFNPQDKGGVFPMTISMQTVRDLLVVGMYVGLLAGQMWLWSWWQKRDLQKPSTEIVTSDFGRPLVKKA